jgi:Protein of unknown function (DUF429)
MLLVSGYARDRSPNSGAVRTAGIDLSSQPVGTAACVVDWRDGIASVESVENLVDDGRLKTLLADTTVDQVGIDVPLGCPMRPGDRLGTDAMQIQRGPPRTGYVKATRVSIVRIDDVNHSPTSRPGSE